jgi:hypothetical protein
MKEGKTGVMNLEELRADVSRRIALVCAGKMDISPPGVEVSPVELRRRQLATGLFWDQRKGPGHE